MVQWTSHGQGDWYNQTLVTGTSKTTDVPPMAFSRFYVADGSTLGTLGYAKCFRISTQITSGSGRKLEAIRPTATNAPGEAFAGILLETITANEEAPLQFWGYCEEAYCNGDTDISAGVEVGTIEGQSYLDDTSPVKVVGTTVEPSTEVATSAVFLRGN